jgi:hypothetical protein
MIQPKEIFQCSKFRIQPTRNESARLHAAVNVNLGTVPVTYDAWGKAHLEMSTYVPPWLSASTPRRRRRRRLALLSFWRRLFGITGA